MNLFFSVNDKLKHSYCHGTSEQPLLGTTIGQMFDKTVEKFPDREAYVFCEDGNRATFSQFKQEVGTGLETYNSGCSIVDSREGGR